MEGPNNSLRYEQNHLIREQKFEVRCIDKAIFLLLAGASEGHDKGYTNFAFKHILSRSKKNRTIQDKAKRRALHRADIRTGIQTADQHEGEYRDKWPRINEQQPARKFGGSAATEGNKYGKPINSNQYNTYIDLTVIDFHILLTEFAKACKEEKNFTIGSCKEITFRLPEKAVKKINPVGHEGAPTDQITIRIYRKKPAYYHFIHLHSGPPPGFKLPPVSFSDDSN